MRPVGACCHRRPMTRGDPLPRRRALALAATTLLVATLVAGSGPASAGPGGGKDQRARETEQLRICDPTGCYVAWRVVDSDHDGVSDADELVAGTDPHDARSRPGLQVVAELGADRKLPTFEAGRGAFVLFPPEIVEMLSTARPDLLGAFPMFARKDSATRLGISADQMAAAGVDPARTGMTIGLDRPAKDGGRPGRRVAGIDAGLISAGTTPPVGTVPHGGVVSSSRTWDGRTVNQNADGSKDTWRDKGGGDYSVQHENADGSEGDSTDIHSSTSKDGDTTIFQEDREVTNADGDLVSTTSSESHLFDSGAVSTIKVVTEYVRDGDGNVTGTVVTTTVGYVSADGEYGSEAKTVEECDASGGNCTEVDYEFEDSDTVDPEEHVDPDADTSGGGIVTFEMVDGVLRTRGAAVTVVQHWEAPGHDAEDPLRRGTYILVDSEQALTYTILEAPRVTEAQPEIRSDLPNPLEAAPPPTGGGGSPCDGVCRS